jgi:hypothetical protein
MEWRLLSWAVRGIWRFAQPLFPRRPPATMQQSEFAVYAWPVDPLPPAACAQEYNTACRQRFTSFLPESWREPSHRRCTLSRSSGDRRTRSDRRREAMSAVGELIHTGNPTLPGQPLEPRFCDIAAGSLPCRATRSNPVSVRLPSAAPISSALFAVGRVRRRSEISTAPVRRNNCEF